MSMRMVVVIFSAMLVGAAAGPAHASPVRSGTILVPDRPTNGVGPMPGCAYTPDCLAWLTTCTQAVASETGVSSSIVDVGNLAGLSTTRTFAVVDRIPSTFGSGVTVELWDGRCRPVAGRSAMPNTTYTTFTIPEETKWMTVVPGCYWLCFSIGGVALRWELR